MDDNMKPTPPPPQPPKPEYGKAERCPSTLVPNDDIRNPQSWSIRCILPRGHEGPHQDHLLPKRRWTGD